ncbi:MAG: hypothetical protein PHY48_01815 [Candidatus Cloacimonetes bacterium]|nr:hypothetical protein [Candidatus Cloacimonadota bacterium]
MIHYQTTMTGSNMAGLQAAVSAASTKSYAFAQFSLRIECTRKASPHHWDQEMNSAAYNGRN